MRTKIRRIGNSLGLTFKSGILESAEMKEGDEVDIGVMRGSILISAATKRVEIELSVPEANALVQGDLGSEDAKSALEKIRNKIQNS